MTQQPQQEPSANLSLRTICMIAYALFALGFVTTGVFTFATLAAIIMVYVKRPEAAGTLYATHFDWMISTFLWALLWLALSFLTMGILIGWLGLIATVVWVLYRLIKGFFAVLEGKPIGIGP